MVPRRRLSVLVAMTTLLQRYLCAQAFANLQDQLVPFRSRCSSPSPLEIPPPPAAARRHSSRSTPVLPSLPEAASSDVSESDTEALKQELLDLISDFQDAQQRDGSPSIDFGVKGGELNSTSRAPQKVDYYAVSPRVGKAADAVIELCCHRLPPRNPTPEPTKYLGDKDRGSDCPLDGSWKLLFTTAADASFSKNSTRGAATAQNVVDAARGKITNVIDFHDRDDGRPPLLRHLNVVIKATAEGPSRVGLRFLYARAVFTRFLFLPLRWSLYIPVPAPFLTRLIVLFYRLLRRGTAVKPPKAYFDVLFLDDDLRIHRTGEKNLFVQARPSWSAANNLWQ